MYDPRSSVRARLCRARDRELERRLLQRQQELERAHLVRQIIR